MAVAVVDYNSLVNASCLSSFLDSKSLPGLTDGVNDQKTRSDGARATSARRPPARRLKPPPRADCVATAATGERTPGGGSERAGCLLVLAVSPTPMFKL